jgi:hypothetical protein
LILLIQKNHNTSNPEDPEDPLAPVNQKIQTH